MLMIGLARSWHDTGMHRCSASELGRILKPALLHCLPPSDDLSQVALFFVKNYIAVHTDAKDSKYLSLTLMAEKLLDLVHGRCLEDNLDSLEFQEVLLPGALLTALIKEKLEEALRLVAASLKWRTLSSAKHSYRDQCVRALDRYVGPICSKVEAFLSSGNLVSSTGLDMQQTTGFVIVAERLNMWRYVSHFRSVHRGQFFTTMKTTSVRKLLPESWGFFCPVHTPDGTPCGLLSHLASTVTLCRPTTPAQEVATNNICNLLTSLGAVSSDLLDFPLRLQSISVQSVLSQTTLGAHIVLNGAIVAYASSALCERMETFLRYLKSDPVRTYVLNPRTEVVLIRSCTLQDPRVASLHILTNPARLFRPVMHLNRNHIEYIGPLEQARLRISCFTRRLLHKSSHVSRRTTHAETCSSNILSVLASLTPFSDFNQSPRNMYQCQMGKQTMGTPVHNFLERNDSKLYRLITPQSPLVCTHQYNNLQFDSHAQGVNSVLAIVSYTGYDMEDAMILNKSSYERGFGHGSVYKTHIVDLGLEAEKRCPNSSLRTWSFSSMSVGVATGTLFHGLPAVGVGVSQGSTFWTAQNATGDSIAGTYSDTEPAIVDSVRLLGPRFGQIILAINEQVGCLSQVWPRAPAAESFHNLQIPAEPSSW